MVIYKYPLDMYIGEQEIELPINAQILTAQMQCGTLQLWALVNEKPPVSCRKYIVKIYSTGMSILGLHGSYIATFQMDEGRLVFHVFIV